MNIVWDFSIYLSVAITQAIGFEDISNTAN